MKTRQTRIVSDGIVAH